MLTKSEIWRLMFTSASRLPRSSFWASHRNLLFENLIQSHFLPNRYFPVRAKSLPTHCQLCAETFLAPPLVFTKTNDVEMVIYCGSPACGKSTFYWKQLKPQGYERVNQDILKSRDRCIKVASEHLANGESVLIGNGKNMALLTKPRTNTNQTTQMQAVKLAPTGPNLLPNIKSQSDAFTSLLATDFVAIMMPCGP